MSINQIRTILILFATAAFYTSCTKVDSKMDPEPDPGIVDSVPVLHYKDSTVLIRSITKLRTNKAGKYLDSITFYIYYDSLNRKINFNSEYRNSPIPTDSSTVHSYNSNGLLVQLDRNNSAGTLTNKYTYDPQNILSSAEIELKPGVRKTENFIKKMLPGGGYSLSLRDSSYYPSFEPIDANTFEFNAQNQLVFMGFFRPPNKREGFTDSLFYDDAGNVNKVVETIYSSNDRPSTITYFEFSDRASRGDQFYNFNKKVYNGISDFPEFLDNFLSGSPLTGAYNEGLYQFIKYPASNNRIYTWSDYQVVAYINFDSDAEYDRANRLVKLKLYVGRDYHYTNEYRLTYYK